MIAFAPHACFPARYAYSYLHQVHSLSASRRETRLRPWVLRTTGLRVQIYTARGHDWSQGLASQPSSCSAVSTRRPDDIFNAGMAVRSHSDLRDSFEAGSSVSCGLRDHSILSLWEMNFMCARTAVENDVDMRVADTAVRPGHRDKRIDGSFPVAMFSHGRSSRGMFCYSMNRKRHRSYASVRQNLVADVLRIALLARPP